MCGLLLGSASPPESPAQPAPSARPLPERQVAAVVPVAPVAPPAPIVPPAPPPLPAPPPEPVEPAPDTGLRIVVSIPEQKAYVFDDGLMVATSTVSTGKPGHETPVGTFRILQKKVHHRSNLYDDAPMPFMQRLTWQGVALHAGSVPGYPASHGCIRLPRSFAKKLYNLTNFNTWVTVTDQSPASAEEALTLA
jgi:lipoprotein-anchoring transpeptidase ErfK/SrfK